MLSQQMFLDVRLNIMSSYSKLFCDSADTEVSIFLNVFSGINGDLSIKVLTLIYVKVLKYIIFNLFSVHS